MVTSCPARFSALARRESISKAEDADCSVVASDVYKRQILVESVHSNDSEHSCQELFEEIAFVVHVVEEECFGEVTI